jgi:hypothetical protein
MLVVMTHQDVLSILCIFMPHFSHWKNGVDEAISLYTGGALSGMIPGVPRNFLILPGALLMVLQTHLKIVHPISLLKPIFNCHSSSVPQCEWYERKLWALSKWGKEGKHYKWKVPNGRLGLENCLSFEKFCLRLMVGIKMIIIVIRKWCPVKWLVGHDAVLRELYRPTQFLHCI